MWPSEVYSGEVAVMDTSQEQNAHLPLHSPAMVAEVLQVLQPVRGERAIDLTAGTGGHALVLAERLGPEGLLIGIDADLQALRVAKARLAESAPCPFKLFRCRFSEAQEVAREAGVEGFHIALADLGVGTHQLDDPSRGFSFESEAKLDMRFDDSAELSAWDVVNRTPQRRLAEIFQEFGEERFSNQIAAAIFRERQEHTIDSPAQLSKLVKRVAARYSGGRTWRIHPATRAAMALRIFVNDELGELERLLELLPSLLVRGGRIAILTYHSLEARRVKLAWQQQKRQGIIEIITKSPLRPSPEEVARNPRTRSAQLRAARRI